MISFTTMSNLDQELKGLIDFFQSTDPASMNIEDGMKNVVRFFEKMTQLLETASPEHKKGMTEQLNELFQKLSTTLTPFGEAAGMSDEDLLTLAENPKNFQEEQWKMMQELRGQVTECAKKIASSMVSSEGSVEPAAPKQEESPKVDKKKPHIPPRSTWMKS